MTTKSLPLLLLACSLVASPPALFAEIGLPSILSDYMVLQRELPVPIWGWTEPGETVTVSFADQEKSAEADAHGKWEVRLDPMEASAQGRTMTIITEPSGFKRQVSEVLVGEVWLASGQSNMEWSIKKAAGEEHDLFRSIPDFSHVRSFRSPHLAAGVPLSDGIGEWSTGETIQRLRESSAVGVWFAFRLHNELGVPVAFLDLNKGGAKIESFIPDQGYMTSGLEHTVASDADLQEYLDALNRYQEQLNQDMDKLNAGQRLLIQGPPSPKGTGANKLHNGMIAPVAPFAIRGALWYQGESNVGDEAYFQKLKALHAGWSKVFQRESLPLLIVQLPPLDYHEVGPNGLCDNIWTAQYAAERDLPGVGVVPIHDTIVSATGHGGIHPPFKRPVGERLAEMALARCYAFENYPRKAPRVKTAKLYRGGVAVAFDHAPNGLVTNDGEVPAYFELSEDGKNFMPADARIEKRYVFVTIPEDLQPRYVRMGWANIAVPNLAAKEGWPVLAFPAFAIELRENLKKNSQ